MLVIQIRNLIRVEDGRLIVNSERYHNALIRLFVAVIQITLYRELQSGAVRQAVAVCIPEIVGIAIPAVNQRQTQIIATVIIGLTGIRDRGMEIDVPSVPVGPGEIQFFCVPHQTQINFRNPIHIAIAVQRQHIVRRVIVLFQIGIHSQQIV